MANIKTSSRKARGRKFSKAQAAAAERRHRAGMLCHARGTLLFIQCQLQTYCPRDIEILVQECVNRLNEAIKKDYAQNEFIHWNLKK